MKIDRDEIAKLLKEKGATNPCHRCNQKQFTVLEGYSPLTLQDDIGKGFNIGGPAVPVALVACNNCGAIAAHALGALGLLPKDELPKPEKAEPNG